MRTLPPPRTSVPPERTRLREGLLVLGFLLVVAAAVFTVALPELGKAPDDASKPAQPAQTTP